MYYLFMRCISKIKLIGNHFASTPLFLGQGIAPLLIKQIHKMPDSGIVLYGMTFGMVTIVGLVRAIEHSSTKVTYTLEDHTGRIEAHLWLEEGDTLNAPNIILNTYARVFGSLRVQGGGKTIMLFKINPIESANELTNHLLEVLMTRYKAEDFSNNGVRPVSDAGKANANTNGGHGNDAPSNGLQGKEKLIFDAVKAYRGDSGISVDELHAKFSTMQASEI